VSDVSELRILAILGRGAGGTVSRAVHVPTGTVLALKQLNLFEDAGKHEEVIKELRTLHTADSPFIISFCGAFYAEGTVAIALEYMDAGSLADIMKRTGTFPEPAIACVAYQSLQGLVFLHKERHIVHRDLKPANILANSRGEVKIADFGVNRELEHSFDAAGSFVGTAPYMSPERITGGQYSYSSDVWSLGLTLLECAIGRYPYPQPRGYIDLHQNIVNLDAPAVPRDAGWSLQFAHFVSLCLDKDPNSRPSAFDLLAHPFISMHASGGFSWPVWLNEALGGTVA
jgi:serine/threonine protein kinase